MSYVDIPHNWPAPYPGCLEFVADRVCWYCDTTLPDVKAHNRLARLVEARGLIAWFSRELTGATLYEIAIVIGRDPSAVHRLIERTKERQIWDRAFRQRIEEIRRLFP